jgi:hypothetical protein
MPSMIDDEDKRISALALWRYAHDYLRAAQSLSRKHDMACLESTAPLHLATEGLRLAVTSYLRAKGATLTELEIQVGRSLTKALACGEAQGLSAIPERWRHAITAIEGCCQDDRFIYPLAAQAKAVDVETLVEAGVWILDRIAPDVAGHYVRHLAGDASPSTEEFVGRLRADLRATSDVAAP